MDDHDLAAKFLQDHFTATAALIALMLKDLPEFVRTRTFDAVRNGTGKLELRTRADSNETELVLVPTMGRSRYGWHAQANLLALERPVLAMTRRRVTDVDVEDHVQINAPAAHPLRQNVPVGHDCSRSFAAHLLLQARSCPPEWSSNATDAL